jgi:RNase H-fold protein (predicted Holliday junction resolvase)
LKELNNLNRTGKLLAIDYGTKNIGLATSDKDQILSFAKKVLKKDENFLEELRLFILSENITAGIIVGKTFLNNTDLDVDSFCQELKTKFKLPVQTFNEDFSTSEAFENMELGELSTSEQQKQKDAYAAQIILEKYLSSKD